MGPVRLGVLVGYIRDIMHSFTDWAQRFTQQPSDGPLDAMVTYRGAAGDSASEGCSECSRFRSRTSRTGVLCTYHDVAAGREIGSDSEPKSRSCKYLVASLKMWLKSIVGANIGDAEAALTIAVVDSFLCFAESFRATSGDAFRFCEESLADYRLVYRYLECESGGGDHLQPQRTRAVIECLQRLVVFRKFHQPVKGIIANRYASTERLLEDCLGRCRRSPASPACRLLRRLRADSDDIDRTLAYHGHKYRLIVSLLQRAHDVRSLEAGQDLEFATSFVCCFLCQRPQLRIGQFGRLLVSDLGEVLGVQPEERRSRAVGKRRRRKLAAHESGRGGRVEKPSVGSHSVLSPYLRHVRPRLSKTSSLLLLTNEGLGLQQHTVRRKISMLIYEALGKEVAIGDHIHKRSL